MDNHSNGLAATQNETVSAKPVVWVEEHLSEGLRLSRNMLTWRQRWLVLFDHLQCTECQRMQNIWLADEPFKHEYSCALGNEEHQHPWHELASILTQLPPATRHPT